MYLQRLFSLIAILLIIPALSFAQEVTYTVDDSFEMIIDGEANIKNWHAQVTEINGTLVLQNIAEVTAETLTPEAFKSLSLTIPVDGIDAESGGLRKNIHKYMNKDDYPNVTFELNSVTDVTPQDGSLLVTANGVVTASGEEYEAEMQVTANILDGGIQFTGEQQLLMTDFGIDPPTAVFGTIRSKDEIVIKFDVSFSR